MVKKGMSLTGSGLNNWSRRLEWRMLIDEALDPAARLDWIRANQLTAEEINNLVSRGLH